MKFLVFGRDGQVGEALRGALAPLGDVIALGRAEAPFNYPENLDEIVASQRPDVIVNAAAYTAVDKAESAPEMAYLVNADAVAALADISRRAGVLLVHYSTDYVFDGSKAAPYLEDDEPAPLGVYGRSKLAGDAAILASGCRHLIFRVSWVYAPGHANFPQAMLNLAKSRPRLDVVADQVGAPTSAGWIARVTSEVLAKLLSASDPEVRSGLYHLAPSGAVNRADLARFIVMTAAALGAKLALEPASIASIATVDYRLPAARPLNSRLDTGKLRRTFCIELPPWQDDVRDWVAAALAEEGA